MEKTQSSRRSSSGSVSSMAMDFKKKKSGISFLNVFSKKSEESGKSSGNFMSYLRNRKNSAGKHNNVDKPANQASPDWEKDDPSNEARSYNTWSLRQTSLSEPYLPTGDAHLRCLNLLGNQKSPTIQPACSVPLSPNNPSVDGTPATFVNLFTPLNSCVDSSHLKPLGQDVDAGHRNSLLSENESLDCDEISCCSDDRVLSRNSSIKSRSSINLTPPSPPLRPASPPVRDRQDLNPRLSPKLFLRKRGPSDIGDFTKNFLSRITGGGVKRPLCDVAEEGFDTWDGRNAMTLPRHMRNGKASVECFFYISCRTQPCLSSAFLHICCAVCVSIMSTAVNVGSDRAPYLSFVCS